MPFRDQRFIIIIAKSRKAIDMNPYAPFKLAFTFATGELEETQLPVAIAIPSKNCKC